MHEKIGTRSPVRWFVVERDNRAVVIPEIFLRHRAYIFGRYAVVKVKELIESFGCSPERYVRRKILGYGLVAVEGERRAVS